MTGAQQLRAAARTLRTIPAPPLPVVEGREDGEVSTRYTIAVCVQDHTKAAYLDDAGHCRDCEFLFTYDQELAKTVRALISAARPVAVLLDGHATTAEQTGIPAAAKALAVARAMEGGAT